MKSTLKNLLVKFIPLRFHSPIKKIIHFLNKSPDFELINQLKNHLPTINCIDVGASYFPHPHWHLFLKSSKTNWIAVEPNKQNLLYVSKWQWPARVTAVPHGLSNKGGQVPLYITNVDSGSSLCEPKINPSMKHRFKKENLDYYFPMQKVTVDTQTLADVFNMSSNLAPYFIKLDTQGSELSIIKGAESFLKNGQVVGIELESTLLSDPIMSGSAKFWEAMQYLEAFDFELLDITAFNMKSKINTAKCKHLMNECDAIFALKWSEVKTRNIDFKIALLAFYVTYYFYEEAANILNDDSELLAFFKERNIPILDLISNSLKKHSN